MLGGAATPEPGRPERETRRGRDGAPSAAPDAPWRPVRQRVLETMRPAARAPRAPGPPASLGRTAAHRLEAARPASGSLCPGLLDPRGVLRSGGDPGEGVGAGGGGGGRAFIPAPGPSPSILASRAQALISCLVRCASVLFEVYFQSNLYWGAGLLGILVL